MSRADGWQRVRKLARRLSDAQLIEAWRCSAMALRATSDARTATLLAALRHSYLDELERRDTHGFAQWMRSAPTPDTDPSEYLTLGRRSRRRT